MLDVPVRLLALFTFEQSQTPSHDLVLQGRDGLDNQLFRIQAVGGPTRNSAGASLA
jgi:hypothetical protein